MRRFRWLRLTAAAVAVSAMALIGMSADPVSADESEITSDVFGEPLDEFLESYPDARPLGDGSYELAPGVVLAPPAASDSDVGITEWPSGCADQWFCVYQHAGFEGWSLSYYYCSTVDLAPEHRNAISSMHNAQNSLSAYFWDLSPYAKGALGPNKYLRNLANDTAPDGRSWNDRIDRVKAC